MAHTNNIVSRIKLPNSDTIYQIHDSEALHTIEDLGNLGLSGVLVFKGTVTAESELPTAGEGTIGHVYLNTTNNIEYVGVAKGSPTTYAWEKLGNIHNAASTTHTHTVTNVTGTNAASTVTGHVVIPTVSKTTKYTKVTATQGSISTDRVLGADTQFTTTVTPSTTNIKATASGTAVGANGTANAITAITPNSSTFIKTVPATDVSVVIGIVPTGGDAITAIDTETTDVITGFGAHTTENAATALNTTIIKNPTVTPVSIPNVTGNSTVTASKVKSAGSKTAGTAATWSASVSNGILSFSWTPNTPTAVTLPTFDDVTATNTTLGAALSASSVSTSNVTVATGIKSTAKAITALGTPTTAAAVTTITPDTGSFLTGLTTNTSTASKLGTPTTDIALTGLGTPTTKAVLTGVKVTAQPTVALATGATAGTGVISVATGISSAITSASGDVVTAATNVNAPTVTLAAGTSTDGFATGDTVTIGSTNGSIVNGSAAAQKWTFGSGSTGQPQ